MRNILTVWQKEMRDTLRDRRTLSVMLVVPIFLYPLLFILVGQVAKNNITQKYSVAVAGAMHAPALVAALRADHTLQVRLTGDPRAAVLAKTSDVGLLVPAGLAAEVAAGREGRVELIEDSTRGGSSTGADEVQSALKNYSFTVIAARLGAHGLSTALLFPLHTGTTDIATKQQRGGFLLSFILPLFIVLYAIAGGMYTAMDVSAGEKERSTLEALLLTPCTRLEITLGKLLATASVAFVTIIAALTSMVASLSRFPPTTDSNGSTTLVSLDPKIVPLIFILGILMALAFSALELALGILARSFKEAQSYITPLYLASFLPVAIINGIPGFQPPPAIFLVPAINAVLLFKEALIGQTNTLHAAITLLSLLAFAALSVSISVFMFTREKVLLKT